MRWKPWCLTIPLVGCADPMDTDQGTPTDPRPVLRYVADDLGPGRCLHRNVQGTVLGLDEDDVPMRVDADGTRTLLPPPAAGSTVVGLVIDDVGTVWGYADDVDRGRVAMKHAGDGWEDVAGVAPMTALLGAAPGGRVVGVHYAPEGPRAVFLVDGVPAPLPLPDRIHAAYGTSSDRVVGMMEVEGRHTHPFVIEGGALVDLGTLGGADGSALAVNEHGDVAGTVEAADGRAHAVVRYGGAPAWTDLGLGAGAVSSDARGVDADHRVVGNDVLASGSSRAWVRPQDAALIDLTPRDAEGRPFASAHAASVAADGVIVGWGVLAYDDDDATPAVRCLIWRPSQEAP